MKPRKTLRSALVSTLFLTSALIGCNSPAGVPPAAAAVQTRDYIVVIDLSASRTPSMEADAEVFLRGLAQQLTFGDKLTLLQMQQSGVTDHPLRWSTELPLPSDPGYTSARDKSRLVAAQAGVHANLQTFFKHPAGDRILRTDVLATLHIAAEAAQDAGGRPVTLLLLSDMLQSANGIEMEGQRKLPPPGWLQQQQQAGLVASFPGACVVVVGADATTPGGIAVRHFWERYFAAAGTQLQPANYRTTPPNPQRELCR